MPDIYIRAFDKPLMQNDAHKFPFIFDCEEPGCYWHTAHASWGQAANTRLIHRASTCPLDGSSKVARHGNPVGSSIIEKFWIELDQVTKFLIEAPDDIKQNEDFRIARGKAQGIAKCIFIISSPHFETPEHVGRWAMRRYKMEHKGLEFEPTPGVKGYNPPVPTNTPQMSYREMQQKLDPAKRPAAKRTAAPAPSGNEEVAKMDANKKLLATNAIKAGFPDNKVIALTKISAAALASLKQEVAAEK